MRRVFELLLLLSFLFMATGRAFAQKEKADAAPKGLVKIPVWVEEGGNGFWIGGNRQAFKVFVEEKEAQIKSFQNPRSSSVVLVVFDTVADLSRVDQARGALTEAIKQLGENYWLGLLRSQDSLSVIQEPTPDRALLIEKIQSIQVNGKAGLLDTLEPVSKLATGMMQKAGVRVSILYVTDSGIGNYRADYLNPVVNSSDSGDLSRRFSDRAVQEKVSRLAESLSQFTVPVFVLHLEYRGDSLNLAYQSGLERIAQASGGVALFCRTNDDIDSSLKNILLRIQSSYFLGIDQPSAKRRSVKLRIEASKPDGGELGKTMYREQLSLPKK